MALELSSSSQTPTQPTEKKQTANLKNKKNF